MGERARAIRLARGWTLQQVADRTGLAVSTVSKVERGESSLTYDRFMRLAQGLGLDVGELFHPEPQALAPGTVHLCRAGEGAVHETAQYRYEMLAAGLAGTRMVPMIGTVKARSRTDFDSLIAHPGEEFMVLLEGELQVEFERGDPLQLSPGDSLYFDSALGHAYLSAGETDARMLVCCWRPG